MKLRMAENSLFAILLRSSWWISAAVALAIVAVSHALLPPDLAWVGAAGGLPFLVIAGMASWRQWRRPSARQVDALRAELATMSWDRLADLLAQAYARQGHDVERLQGKAADFVLRGRGRTTLVAARRWKAARTGVEPLRELVALRRTLDAQACTYLTLHALTEPAWALAKAEGIVVEGAEELATLMAGMPRSD